MGLYSIGPSYCCMILEKWYKSDATVWKEKLIEQVNIAIFRFYDAEITQLLRNYLKKHEELVKEHNRLVLHPEDNN
jgi:hypothetical protein